MGALSSPIAAWTSAAIAIAVSGAATASAQTVLDDAEARYAAADFPGTLEALEAAIAAPHLERAELVQLIELRALVHFGLGDEAALDRDLAALAGLGYTAGDRVPPRVLAALERVRADGAVPIELRGTTVRLPESVTIDMSVEGDRAEIVRGVRVRWSAGEAGGESSELRVVVPASPETRVAWSAAALGPGEVLIAEASGEDAPIASVGSVSDAPGGASRSSSEIPVWPFVLAGAVVAAAVIAIVIGVVVGTASTDDTAVRIVFP